MLIRFRDGNTFPSPFSMFDDFFSRDLTSFFGRDVQDWMQRNQGMAMPAVNISENEQNFQIELAAPGLRKEDFRVNVEQNMLTISAQQESRSEEEPTSQRQQPTQGTKNNESAGQSGDGGQAEGSATGKGEASGQVATQGASSTAMQPQVGGQPQRYTRREFSYQSFQRSFTLPESVDAEKISANYQHGILIVTVPKREQPARLSRNIDIS